MPQSAWSYLKQRVGRVGRLTLLEDGGVAVATVALAWAFLDRQSARDKMIDAVGYGLGAAVVYQLVRWAGRFVFAIPHDMHNELLAQRDQAVARVAQLEAQTPVTRAEWMQISKEFQAVQDSGVYAQWSQVGEEDSWGIYGALDCARQIEALSKRAGAMLFVSPRVAAKLSEKVRARSLPMERWLELLREQPNVIPSKTGTGTDHGTPTKGEMYEGIAILSAAICVQCSAEEI